MLSRMPNLRTWHNVGGRVQTLASVESPTEGFAVVNRVKGRDRRFPNMAYKVFPGFDPVEYLEQEHSEHGIRPIVHVAIDHSLKQILANPVRGTVGVGETIRSKYLIGGPRPWLAVKSSHEYVLTLGGKIPVLAEHFGYFHTVAIDNH